MCITFAALFLKAGNMANRASWRDKMDLKRCGNKDGVLLSSRITIAILSGEEQKL